jgi:hypothetical protein
MSACKSCGRSIRWVVLLGSSKSAPVDDAPSDKGTIKMVSLPSGETARGTSATMSAVVLKKEELTAAREAGTPLYTSHFATCPDAASFRKARP